MPQYFDGQILAVFAIESCSQSLATEVRLKTETALLGQSEFPGFTPGERGKTKEQFSPVQPPPFNRRRRTESYEIGVKFQRTRGGDMRRLLFLLILGCSLCGNAFGQAADTATCRLTAAQFPAVRGLRLGMTPDEVLSVLPTVLNKDALFKQAHSPDHFDVASLDYAPNQNGDPPQFADVSGVNMVFYRGKLADFRIQYKEPGSAGGVAWQGVANFIARIAEVLQVPSFQAWTRGSMGALVLKCEGFELQVPNTNVLRIVAMPFWVDDMDARQKAENDEKRRTFRP